MEVPIAAPPAGEREPAAPELVEALLAAADRVGPWSVESVARVGWMNSNTTIQLADGTRCVVRRYRWPFDEPPAYDRAAKEAWLHPRLAAAGVPVATVLATADAGTDRGALLEWMPGEPLGVVAQRVPADALEDAWREAGAALRRAHDVVVPASSAAHGAGFLAADGVVVPFPGGSFGGFHRARLAEYARAAAEREPGLGVDPDRIDELAARAVPVVDAAPPRLGHSDAHPWNVLVAPDAAGRWHLSAWLDWEFAWLGDPAWDHMRMTTQRFAPIGPTPPAWYDGYGTRPPAANLAIATLRFMLWKAVDRDDTRDRAVAHAWLADLPAHLDALDALLP